MLMNTLLAEEFVEYLHHLGLRRLYFEPSLPIKNPSITKFAATSGVGAMIVVVILRL